MPVTTPAKKRHRQNLTMKKHTTPKSERKQEMKPAMKVEIYRERRSENEGIALCVIVHGEPGYPQFKIDLWSLKAENELHLRLDGFGFLRFVRCDDLPQAYGYLMELEGDEVAEENQRIIPEGYRTPSEVITEYVDTALFTVLGEIEPMLNFANS
jgi:hypothetical protein